MRELQLSPDGRFRKCARVVGDVIGSTARAAVAVSPPRADGAGLCDAARLVDGHGLRRWITTRPRRCATPSAGSRGRGRRAHGRPRGRRRRDRFHRQHGDGDRAARARRCHCCCSTAASGIAVGMATNVPPHNLASSSTRSSRSSTTRAPTRRRPATCRSPTSDGRLIMGAGLWRLHEIGRGSVVMRADALRDDRARQERAASAT